MLRTDVGVEGVSCLKQFPAKSAGLTGRRQVDLDVLLEVLLHAVGV